MLQTYKILHLVGILTLFISLGGLCTLSMAAGQGGTQTPRKILSILHGIALALILVGGFGLLARMGIAADWPLWVWLKLVIWLLLAAVVALIKRSPALAGWLLVVLPLLGGVAAYLAIFKPAG